MRKFYFFLVALMVSTAAMAQTWTSEGTFTSKLADMYETSGCGTITVTKNGENYDLSWTVFYGTPFGNSDPIELKATNVELVDGVFRTKLTNDRYEADLTATFTLGADKTEAKAEGTLARMAFEVSEVGTAIDLTKEPTTAINNVNANLNANRKNGRSALGSSSKKFLMNNRVVIIKDGRSYRL